MNNTLNNEPDAAARILNNTLNPEPDAAGRVLNNTLNPEPDAAGRVYIKRQTLFIAADKVLLFNLMGWIFFISPQKQVVDAL